MSRALPVWLEVHVDDELLAQDHRRWPAARDLVRGLADLAEGRGARLSFRFRRHFAAASVSEHVLPELLERGHGVGVHAHATDLARADRAVRACGVQPEVVVPGLVQAGERGRDDLLRRCKAHGYSLVTDHGPRPSWAYEGLELREEHGLLVMAPTVRPFDWGLMETTGQRHGLGPEQVARLRRLESLAAQQGARWFGLALHEHDLCEPGSLRPRPASLESLADYLDEHVQTAVSAARQLHSLPRSSPPLRRPGAARAALRDGRAWVVRRVITRTDRLPGRRVHRRVGPGPQPPSFRVSVDGDTVPVDVVGPPGPRGIVLMSHAGAEGGRTLGLRPFGLSPSRLADEGWELWTWDRAGSGSRRSSEPLTPGNLRHVREWEAVLARARQPRLPVVALTWSAGLLPVLRAASRGHRPDAVVDGEGPVDRWSLVPPPSSGVKTRELGQLDPWAEADWVGLEAVRLLPALERPYLRLQARPDHVHGDCTLHAERVVAVAQELGLLAAPLELWEGPLHAHGAGIIEALRIAMAAPRPRPPASA